MIEIFRVLFWLVCAFIFLICIIGYPLGRYYHRQRMKELDNQNEIIKQEIAQRQAK